MSKNASPSEREFKDEFVERHIGPNDEEIAVMLEALGLASLDSLTERAIPADVRVESPLVMAEALGEIEVLERLRQIAALNHQFKTMIGMGYYACHTPAVILRNILENPAWYTAYTPYQPEISQGRLEGLLNFQTMVCDLTAMEIANASLLDEATAAAEAMTMCFSLRSRKDQHRHTFWVMDDVHPQTLEVLETRARPLGIELVVGTVAEFAPRQDYFGLLLQYPSSSGAIRDYESLIGEARDQGIMSVVATDLLSLTMLKPPGEMGADVVVGSSQRFGVPLGFGGPHAAFFATREAHKRAVPGRLVGVSVDSRGRVAYRLALQTREQHIRREKATSNICTSQVLLAVIAGAYAVYHGPDRLRGIARRVHRLARTLGEGLANMGHHLRHQEFFDTIIVEPNGTAAPEIRTRALALNINLRYYTDGAIGIACDETTSRADIGRLWQIFQPAVKPDAGQEFHAPKGLGEIPAALERTSPFLTHEVFNSHHSETEMLRYLHRLVGKDLSLAHSMIPLGSCTMKLNATTEMIPISWPAFADIHPFAPADQVRGYARLIEELEAMLADITGFPAISLQPNAGSQGEYTGLLVIRAYHRSRGEVERDICIIPSSAHGTNPASAAMAGMQVVVVDCDDKGNIDIADLTAKAEGFRDRLAALMVTYPSTHGVFEEGIGEICRIIHANGGLVYMDGANMNALVGLCRPGEFGPDVCHLNLHKTFCIPHGGGGPGVGPIGVIEALQPFLPGHRNRADAFPPTATTAVAAAPYGSAGILPISWTYIAMMGRNGLRKATQTAILNANYIAKKLSDHYRVLYKGARGLVAHECIIDLRPFKASAGIEVEDVAKRLIDFGYHSPTMSWPVIGTLMIEPTESESKDELDRFIDALIAIRQEIQNIEDGRIAAVDSPLKYAPHTIADLTDASWDRVYSREVAVYPKAWVLDHKFWPPVNRIDNTYGDRNLVCSCPAVESYR